MVYLLDGGSTHVLQYISEQDQSEIMRSPLWTTQAVYDHPEAVQAMHQSYIEAGATFISCMTYQQSSLTMTGMTANVNAYDRGMALALQAANNTDAITVLSLGSYAAMLSNGAEYNHKFQQNDKKMLKEFHQERLDTFSRQGSWADIKFIAFETIPDVLEALVILETLEEFPLTSGIREKNIWLSFSCYDKSAVPEVLCGVDTVLNHRSLDLVGIWGIGVNCFKEDLIDVLARPLCAKLRDSGLHAIVYPDAGHTWDAITRSFSGPATDPTNWAKNLCSLAHQNHGRVVLGGCCQTGPKHITALHQVLQSILT